MHKKSLLKLSDHFTYGKLLRFTLPSVIMMIFEIVWKVVRTERGKMMETE